MRYSLRFFVALLLLLSSSFASAWWNEDWSFRKQIQIDVTGLSKLDKSGVANEIPILVRLHAGNFQYFGDVQANAEDIRFLAGDDKTPLKFSIEKYEPITQMALLWVYLPLSDNTVSMGGLTLESLWMYYGNANATLAADRAKTFGPEFGLILHFDQNGIPSDASSYQNPISSASSEILDVSFMGKGAKLNGSQTIKVDAIPSLIADPDEGWLTGLWLKIEESQKNAIIVNYSDSTTSLRLILKDLQVNAEYKSPETTLETSVGPSLTPKVWNHLAMMLSTDKLSLWLNGKEVAAVTGTFNTINGSLTIGGPSSDLYAGLVAEVDEIIVLNKVQDSAIFARMIESQSMGANVISYGSDEQAGGETNEAEYFTAILNNVSLDGWMVIISLAFMFSFSFIIIISKSIVLYRTRKDNILFLEDFKKIDPSIPESLDRESTVEEKEYIDSPVLEALFGKHDHYQSSNLYRIYHIGMQQLTSRIGKSVGAQASELSPQSVAAIKASLDAAMVREQQRLNKLMVILTIAISGGPFLGLLGTVLGVMITFAAIAVSGDVNINAIAPGVSAALMTTVAGLAVAIPALFAYNFLSTQIRDLSIDMRVFVDELVARIAEFHR
tara:strand:- start:6704 stop:8539 length:1836 start_codon:yes stop_codon:yes gene_type:complete